MGRPPHAGTPVFRFTHAEVAEMDAYLREVNNSIPSREVISSFAEKFSASADRVGKTAIQFKQVWNWFQNRRYALRAKMIKAPLKLNVSPTRHEDSIQYRNITSSLPAASGRNSSQNGHMDFEARSARDGAWYDVATFLSHRVSEMGDPEVQIRFTGFGNEEDEWINIRKCVRPRSLPCEPSECVVVLPGDLVLCFQEGKDQALYFDAHVLDAQRRRHDIRGCRCRFLVCYDHDQSEEIVPLRKICRRPETDSRLQMLDTSKSLGSMDMRSATKDAPYVSVAKDSNMAEQKACKLPAVFDVNAIAEDQVDEESTPVTVEAAVPATAVSSSTVVPDPLTGDAAMTTRVDGNP